LNWRLISRRRLERTGRRRRSGNFFRQAVLAVDHAHNLPRALVAKWFAAGAAVSRYGVLRMISTVHTNLLYVVTDTTGGSATLVRRSSAEARPRFSGREAKIGWFPS